MKAYIVLLLSILILFSACDIHKPSLPVWDIDLAIPLVNDRYYISDLVDSVNIVIGDNELLYLTGTGEVDTPDIGSIALNPNINESDLPLPSGTSQTISLPFYDSMNNAVLSYGELASGGFRLRFRNIADEANLIRISIMDISDTQGNPITIEYSGDTDWQTIDLQSCHFGEYNSMTELNALDIFVETSSSLPNGDIIGLLDIQMDDSLEFSTFQGILQHKELGINSSSASIDIDYPSGIDEAITLHDASLQIDVANHMGFSCEFVGFFEARRGQNTRRIPIVDENGNNYRINRAENGSPGYSSLLFDNNISELMQIMPEHIEIVDAAFIIDSGSGFGTLHQGNRIVTNYTVDAPFRFWLHEHTVTVEEAVQINISQDNREHISKNLLEAGLELEVMNKIPIGGWIKAYFSTSPDIDPADPESYLFFKELELHSAEISPDWQTLPTLNLSRNELELFTQEDIYLKWEFSFEESQSLIEISASSGDFIAIRSILRGKLKIDQGSK